MTVKDLKCYLENAPEDAVVIALDDCVVPNQQVKPQVVWWSDDRTIVYLGML